MAKVEILTNRGQTYEEVPDETLRESCGHLVEGVCHHPRNLREACNRYGDRCSGTAYLDKRTYEPAKAEASNTADKH